MRLKLGTRGSKLALIQADIVIEALKMLCPGIEIDIKIIKTTGDLILDKDLSKIGGKGVFVNEIETALVTGEIDFAVHSAKDVPHTLPKEFIIGAILKREDPRDVLICKNNWNLNTLPENAKIGTSSSRRTLQLKMLRPDLDFQLIRGNVDTRINKLARGEFDAIILAAAGIKRMGHDKQTEDVFFKNILKQNLEITLKSEYLDIESFIPSPGQGALIIETRKTDEKTLNFIKKLNSENDFYCVSAERSFLREINGSCEVPAGAYCTIKDNKMTAVGFIGDENKQIICRDRVTGSTEKYEILGAELAQRVKNIQNKGF